MCKTPRRHASISLPSSHRLPTPDPSYSRYINTTTLLRVPRKAHVSLQKHFKIAPWTPPQSSKPPAGENTSPSLLPARRSSRRKIHTNAHPLPESYFSEKYPDSPASKRYSDSPTPTRSSNPFSDMKVTTHSRTASDLEAQDPDRARLKPVKRCGVCMIIVCVVIIWGLFMVGVVMFANTMFPGALQWHKLKELKMEMVGTKKAVDALKAKLGEVLRYMDGLRVAGGWQGMMAGMGVGKLDENWTMGAMVGNVSGNANGTVVKKVVGVV
ncbi:hypothetical protein CC86DRAFT_378835 [Ophiobolus disseminans]|uniref:Uncharacterized protein n=1 Tax=Ophiobolus disseminans TaxID=1469910 RepID=A0A6A7ABF0_9PLEO|nr:hypothetical protein CC86DRAFT_378835 [Ophiobolus disseminans]